MHRTGMPAVTPHLPGNQDPVNPAILRYQRAKWTSLVLVGSRVLTIAAGLITIPLVSRYLGGELFGLWMMLTNFVSFLIFADLGVGVGFQNQLIRCFAADDKDNPGAWTANALLILVCMGAVVVLTAALAVPALPWDRLLSLSSTEAREWIVPSTLALAGSFSLGLPAMLLEYVGNAYQRGYLAHGVTAFGRALSLAGVCIGCYHQAPLPVLIAAFIATPHVISLAALLVLWIRVPWLRPRFTSISPLRIHRLIHVGIGMLGVRITHAFAMQGPAIVTAHLQGLSEAGAVAVIQKILTVPGIITQPLLAATQGAMGEASLKGDWGWVRRNLSNLTKINVAVFTFTTATVVSVGGHGLSLLITMESPPPTRILLLLYCIYFGLTSLRLTFGAFLTVIDRVYLQSVYRTIALASAFWFLFLGQPSSIVIIAIFVLVAEIPQLLCTVYEASWVLRSKQVA